MAKKKLTDVEARAAFEELRGALKTTATNEVTFKVDKKTYKLNSVKVSYGTVKKMNLTDEAAITNIFASLWENEIAKTEGLSEIVDELDWEEADELMETFLAPLNDALETIQKKYL